VTIVSLTAVEESCDEVGADSLLAKHIILHTEDYTHFKQPNQQLLCIRRIALPPWNKGRACGQKRPFTAQQIETIRLELTRVATLKPLRIRDLALFNVGLDAMCRANEILSLRVDDIADQHGRVHEDFHVLQSKNGRTKIAALGQFSRDSLAEWIEVSEKSQSDYLWTALPKRGSSAPISRMQYSRLVKSWADIVKIDMRRYSTHSMRRTKSTIIYARTKNLRACQLLLGHCSIGSTAHYLGIDQEDALALARSTEI